MACLASRNGDMLVAFCHTITILEEEGVVSEQGTHILERPYLPLSLTFTRRSLHLSQALSDGSWAMWLSTRKFASESGGIDNMTSNLLTFQDVWEISKNAILRAGRQYQLHVMMHVMSYQFMMSGRMDGHVHGFDIVCSRKRMEA